MSYVFADAKPMSPVHSSIVRYGSSRRFSTSSAFAVSDSSSSKDCSGRGELHELDLVELVLPDQPAHVRAVRAGLAAEARRVCRVPQRQLAAVENLSAVQVGQRHFRGRDQEQIPVAGDLEQVLLRTSVGCRCREARPSSRETVARLRCSRARAYGGRA